MTKREFDVLVVGELNVDLILNDIDSFPEMGKEKLARRMTLTLGSSSAIFAGNLSSLGAKVAFIGKIGQDSFGDLVIDSLREKGVDTGMIIRSGDLKTGATVVLNYGEDRAMVTHAGAMEQLSVDDISETDLNRAGHLHFSSYFLQPALHGRIHELFEKAHRLGMTTSMDPQWDPAETWQLDLGKVLPNVDVFLPNQQEFRLLTGKNDLDAALKVTENFANTIVVKQGNKGSLSWKKGRLLQVPAFLNNQVVDAIGAGDSFNAGFIYKFVQSRPLEDCQRFGNLMGAVNTTAAGGTTAFTDYENVMKIARNKFGYNE